MKTKNVLLLKFPARAEIGSLLFCGKVIMIFLLCVLRWSYYYLSFFQSIFQAKYLCSLPLHNSSTSCGNFVHLILRPHCGRNWVNAIKLTAKINTAKHHWRWSFQLFPVHCLSDDRCIFRLSSLQISIIYVHFLPILTLFGRTKVVSFTQTIKCRR